MTQPPARGVVNEVGVVLNNQGDIRNSICNTASSFCLCSLYLITYFTPEKSKGEDECGNREYGMWNGDDECGDGLTSHKNHSSGNFT